MGMINMPSWCTEVFIKVTAIPKLRVGRLLYTAGDIMMVLLNQDSRR